MKLGMILWLTPCWPPGEAGSADGLGGTAQFNYPRGVAVDPAGNLYVADTDNDTIRKVSSAGQVTTLAGSSGVRGSADGQGNLARFNHPPAWWGTASGTFSWWIYLNMGTQAPVGQGIYVQILAGPVGGKLVPVASNSGETIFSIGAGRSGPGFFDAGIGVLPGVVGTAAFRVKVWQGSATFDTAPLRGSSSRWTQSLWPALPNPTISPSASILLIPGSILIAPIPEPSTLALAVVAAGLIGSVGGGAAQTMRLLPIKRACALEGRAEGTTVQ